MIRPRAGRSGAPEAPGFAPAEMIKPADISVTRRQRPKVLNLGIARAAGALLPALDGMVAGSPHCLAHQQLLGGEIGSRTDADPLGAVVYELRCGPTCRPSCRGSRCGRRPRGHTGVWPGRRLRTPGSPAGGTDNAGRR